MSSGLELVTRDGLLCTLGGRPQTHPATTCVGLTVGSEGTFGVVTRAWVRLLRLPPETVTFLAAYDTVESAGAAVSALVASGVVPAALELMDEPAIAALEHGVQRRLSAGAGAILLIDVDGLHEAVEEQSALVERDLPGDAGRARAPVRGDRRRARQAVGGAQGRAGRLRPGRAELLPLRWHGAALAPVRCARARSGGSASATGSGC